MKLTLQANCSANANTALRTLVQTQTLVGALCASCANPDHSFAPDPDPGSCMQELCTIVGGAGSPRLMLLSAHVRTLASVN